MPPAEQDWKRLARYVVARRKEVGIPTRGELSRATGLSYRLLGDLERGTRELSAGSLAQIEQALGWQPGSSRMILRGAEPAPLAEPGPDAQPDDASAVSPAGSAVSAMRALTDGYQIASELTDLGARVHGARLLEVLGRIGQSLAMGMATGGSEVPDPGYRMAVGTAGRATVLRIALGEYLRQLRKRSGLGDAVVARAMNCPREYLADVESGRAEVDHGFIARLLEAYHVTDPELIRQSVNLAAAAAQSGWWTAFNHVLPSWFAAYLDLEQSAGTIRTYEPALIPGLLQTESYARAVMSVSRPPDLESSVTMRLGRQGILFRPDPAFLWAVVDEAALRRLPGDPQIRREQIDHLILMARKRNIAIQILRSRTPRIKKFCNSGPFSLLRYEHTLKARPDILYIEHLSSALYVDDRTEVERYNIMWNYLGVEALAPVESIGYLQWLSRGYDQPEAEIGDAVRRGA